jgi:anaphase-promoting complex subunit 3
MRWLVYVLLFVQTPDALYRQGVAAFEAGRADEAIPLFEKAATAAKSNAQYWKAYGVALASREDYRASLEPLREACKLDRRLPDACYYFGRALYATDRYEAALEPLGQALQTDTDKARAETALAQALEALGRDQEAERHFRSAMARKDPFATRARTPYGRFLMRQGRMNEALAMLESAQQPESAEALIEYARALMQANQVELAAAKLERLVELTPRDAAARFLLAKAYRRLGRLADAVRQEQAGQELQGSSINK